MCLAATLAGWIGDSVYRKVAAKNIFRQIFNTVCRRYLVEGDVWGGERRPSGVWSVALVINSVNSKHAKHTVLVIFHWHHQQSSTVLRLHTNQHTTSDVNEASWASGQGRGQKEWRQGRGRGPKIFSRPRQRPDMLENNSVCMSMKTKILAFRT